MRFSDVANTAYRNVVDSTSAAQAARNLGTTTPRLLRAAARLGLYPQRTGGKALRLTATDVAHLAAELGTTTRITGLRRSQVLTLTALARAPMGLRSARAVARAAGLSPTAAGRALHELAALDLVESRLVTVAEGRAQDVRIHFANLTHPRWPALAPVLAGVDLRPTRRPTPSRVPKRLRHVFWNAPGEIDPAVHGPYIARRVLRDGDSQAIAWAAGALTAADWRDAARARGLHPRQRALAENLAASAP